MGEPVSLALSAEGKLCAAILCSARAPRTHHQIWEHNILPEELAQGGRPWKQRQTFEQRRSWKGWRGLRETGFLTAVLSCAPAPRSPRLRRVPPSPDPQPPR